MLSKEIEKHSTWKVIFFFVKEGESIHVKGLAKRLGISAGNAHKQLKLLEKEGVLEKQKIGNLDLYSLKETALVSEMKKLAFMLDSMPFFEKFAGQNKNISALAVYGSIAKGNFDKKSDIDLLVISQNKKLNFEFLEELELKHGREVNTTVYSIGEWRKLLGEKNSFAESVLRNNIILYGDGL